MTAKIPEFKYGQFVAWADVNERTRVARVEMPPSEPFNIMIVCNCWDHHSLIAIDSSFFDRLRVLENDPMSPPKEPPS